MDQAYPPGKPSLPPSSSSRTMALSTNPRRPPLGLKTMDSRSYHDLHNLLTSIPLNSCGITSRGSWRSMGEHMQGCWNCLQNILYHSKYSIFSVNTGVIQKLRNRAFQYIFFHSFIFFLFQVIMKLGTWRPDVTPVPLLILKRPCILSRLLSVELPCHRKM